MRKILMGVIPLAIAALVLGGAGVARAQTNQDYPDDFNVVTQTTADGDCNAEAMASVIQKGDFVQGEFSNVGSGFTCMFWLIRSTNGGGSWSVISGYHTLTGTSDTQMTDPYYDGPGYEAEACFKFTSWSGAATHCTDPFTVNG
jgi:hypothetical protein